MTTSVRPDLATVAAIGIVSACLVTFDHEALGHGSACIALGGRIVQLTSALFQCSATSGWIDPAGPAMNLLIGTLALVASGRVKNVYWRLLCILTAAFSFFWEGGYAVKAMVLQDGDLYFAGRFLLGGDGLWWRIAGGVMGIFLFLVAWRQTSLRLVELWPASQARLVARTAWLAATLATGLAALTYSGGPGRDLRDTLLEIGLAAAPLLILPSGDAATATTALPRSRRFILCGAVVFAVFLATLGHGLGGSGVATH